jgi:prevent-host-death family protein
MAKISSTEANRSFSKLLAQVRSGRTAEITVRGEIVAKIVPVEKIDEAAKAEKQRLWEEFIDRLRKQPVLNIPRGTRDELYDDE